MHIRGEINNRDRAKQLRDYSGLCYGNITPTDIDGLIEYKNTAYIIIELKYMDVEIQFGQGLALERLVDDLEHKGKPTLCIISSHNQHNPKKDIDVAKTQVVKFRLKNEWRLLDSDLMITTKELIDIFLEDINVIPVVLEYKVIRDFKVGDNKLTGFMIGGIS